MPQINPVLTTFIEASMRQWKTNMVLVHESGVLETGSISIKRGIFQGDSLSPLLFTMSLNPLSWELQKTGYGCHDLERISRVPIFLLYLLNMATILVVHGLRF